MKPPVIRRFRGLFSSRQPERGVTMVLVAVAMIAIIAMAALSIDVISLYLVKEETQRSADAAALAAARVISISGMTGDPNNTSATWEPICGGPRSAATQAATAVANQNAVGGSAATQVLVTYAAGGAAPDPDCSRFSTGSIVAFSVNPLVTVQVTRAGLPTFFSRIWGNPGNSVSATATAEVFNPSASDLAGNNGPTGTVTAVQPGCVKPWVVPNLDPLNPTGSPFCGQAGAPACNSFVSTLDGAITHGGISSQVGLGTSGVLGETFWLTPDCKANPTNCDLGVSPPQANAATSGSFQAPYLPNLLYVPNLVGSQVVAIPTSCTQGDPYEEAIEGCDAPTNYQCGVPNANLVDLTRNPSNATTNGVQCLIHQTDIDPASPSGQDYLKNYKAPNSYPFHMLAGSSNPLGALVDNPISSSNSIVSLPIYDNGLGTLPINSKTTTNVTFVGFLQVFVNAVDANGNVNVTVMNVAGCGNGNTVPVNPNPVTGTSPVPIRLITPQ